MKKLLISVLIFLLTAVLVACGTYVGPIASTEKATDSESENIESSSNEIPPDTTEDEFTVTLMFNGEPYIPAPDFPMQVQWSDGTNFKRADVDENGVARTTGLDGDYQVTLTSVPEGYTYNSNVHRATNDKKNITIELYSIIKTFGTGTGLYGNDIITINKTGMYRAELKNEKQIIYYEFKPTRAGRYSIESYMDLTDNRFNPLLDVYYGTSSYKNFRTTMNGGGTSSTYTANFKYEVQVDKTMIGNVFAFGIHLDSMDGVYPTYVDFAVQYEGTFTIDFTEPTLMIPKENFSQFRDFGSGYTFVGAETQINGRYIFDATQYKLNPEDGYYYLCNADGSLTDTVLCAKISHVCRFLDMPFNTVEYVGNKALTVSNGTENYKLFIEGSDGMAANSAQTYGTPLVYPGFENTKGYADFCNSDGVYPVTEELKEFLQKYSVDQRLFMDGNGWVELFNPPIYATEEDQWLFACGYYRPN